MSFWLTSGFATYTLDTSSSSSRAGGLGLSCCQSPIAILPEWCFAKLLAVGKWTQGRCQKLFRVDAKAENNPPSLTRFMPLGTDNSSPLHSLSKVV